ncbi:alpha/beta-hydrolase [Tilletiaria anomala UBC 951]|uniref:Dipeptidyl-peptidase V n=1 Tax=Tilletiaria anomala (strain ATCC 24038 / CBS 436.72 / UBC 951) TaxID=1037660 RepID=A0A066V9Z0_TILAU|nr:alpha/beta-hydrolase [Tilletiaria anomala UBC 951]KDN38567.1 alpha/beta-hydrolase [Tilletiaria anomala UBC 951]
MDKPDPRSAALRVYELLAGIPSVSSSSFTPNQNVGTDASQNIGSCLNLKLKTRHFGLEDDLISRLAVPIVYDAASKKITVHRAAFDNTTPVSAKTDTIVSEKVCRETNIKILLREVNDDRKQDGKKRTVELWKGGNLLCSDNVTDVHGAFINDDMFGSLDINGLSRIALYSAEARNPHQDEDDKGCKYEYVPSLGEKSSSNVRPSVFVFTWDRSEEVLEDLPWVNIRGKCIGSLSDCLDPEFQSILFAHAEILPPILGETSPQCLATGYKSLPNGGQRLGIIYCTNRPSDCYSFSLRFASEDKACDSKKKDKSRKLRWATSSPCKRLSPLAGPLGEVLSWRKPRSIRLSMRRQITMLLGTPQGGPHGNATYLRCIVRTVDSVEERRSNPEIRTRDALVTKLADPSPQEFFPWRDITNPWVIPRGSDRESSATFLLNGVRESLATVDAIGIEGVGHDIAERRSEAHGYEIIATDGRGLVVAQASTPNRVPTITVFPFFNAELAKAIDQDGELVYDAAKHSQASILHKYLSKDLFSEIVTAEASGAKSIVLGHAKARRSRPGLKPPTILMPHGGPHGVTPYTFNAGHATLALLGYQIVMPNYTGSIGNSRAFVERLVGRCGELDIADCLEALRLAGVAEADPVYVMGGSHGGFISAHLIGQYPGRFLAAAMRNPVTDIASMVATTDIPDWSYEELGLRFDFEHPPLYLSVPNFRAMRDASPIQHIKRVEARVLLLAGLSDRRVPPQQSMLYYHALKALGKDVDMYTFASADHALDTLESQLWGFERTFVHFDKTAKEQRQVWSLLRKWEGST